MVFLGHFWTPNSVNVKAVTAVGLQSPAPILPKPNPMGLHTIVVLWKG